MFTTTLGPNVRRSSCSVVRLLFALAFLLSGTFAISVTTVSAAASSMFHPALEGREWWMVAPDGKKMKIRAVSLVDTQQFGDAGGLQSYDAVYLGNVAGHCSSNLADAARSTVRADVTDSRTHVTLENVGDTIYFGSARFLPDYSYFWLNSLGQGGALTWYYSTGSGWQPLNLSGKPARATKLNSVGQFSMDIGGFIGPDADGFGIGNDEKANKITWWDLARGFPSDFNLQSIPCDNVQRYYIKGIVTKAFVQAPVLNQLYERATLTDAIVRKYGPAKDGQAIFVKWAAAITRRLRAWGFNATGQYSYRYWAVMGHLERGLPVEANFTLATSLLGSDQGYHIKNVYSGAVCPPGSGLLRYQGLQPDVFETGFAAALSELVAARLSSQGGAVAASGNAYALIPEEADFLFGFNKLSHDHLGYVILSQNPYHPKDAQANAPYSDPILHAKYAFREFLERRYGSIAKLNTAWGTAFTTWDTSSGNIKEGTNAYATGSGFMDEDGHDILADRSCKISFADKFTKPDRPPVREDLDDFVALFASTYARALAAAFQHHPHPPIFMPLYNAPMFAYRQFAPYVDGFWVSIHDPSALAQIYNATHKPLIVADYSTANPDSQAFFDAIIESVTFDRARNRTIIKAPGTHYVFRSAFQVEFRDSVIGVTPRCRYINSCPRLAAAHWDELELAGDYTACVAARNHVSLYLENFFPTQRERATAMAKTMRNVFSARGSDGVAFVVGFEHWSLYDDAVSNWGEIGNFGLATLEDNAYDGIEAKYQMGHDATGAIIGGEERDYGDLLTTFRTASGPYSDP